MKRPEDLINAERLSITALAKRLDVHVATVWRWIRGMGGRKLPSKKIFGRRFVYLTDLEGCYKGWRSDLLKNVVVETAGFDFDPEVTAKIAKLRVRMNEVHISYYPRAYMEGKKIKLSDGFSAGWTLIKYSFLVPFHRCFKPTLPKKYLLPSQHLDASNPRTAG